jgi:hypothetical protein
MKDCSYRKSQQTSERQTGPMTIEVSSHERWKIREKRKADGRNNCFLHPVWTKQGETGGNGENREKKWAHHSIHAEHLPLTSLTELY